MAAITNRFRKEALKKEMIMFRKFFVMSLMAAY